MACGDPAEGPNAWGGSPDPPHGTEKYRSSECAAARQFATKNVGNFEIYNYYDTCYGTSGITMDANERMALVDELRAGAEFGAAMHTGHATVPGMCRQLYVIVAAALNRKSRRACRR